MEHFAASPFKAHSTHMSTSSIPISRTPVIAIVGRTNVGKSTLFNRLIEQKKALVSNIPGTTQDINYGSCAWRDRILTVIDTAGLDMTRENPSEDRIRRQAEMAMAKADVILFLVSVKDGPLPEDKAFAKYLQKSAKKVVLIGNKADAPRDRREADATGWAKLGLAEPRLLSATNGTGVGDMLDELVDLTAAIGKGEEAPEAFARVTIIGRPNVGKSSLLNALAGEERVIVSEVAHTTKEPQDSLLSYVTEDGQTYHLLLTDTVGIRKKSKVEAGIEKSGVSMSLGELKAADVILLVIDATDGINLQEKKLLGLAADNFKSIIIVVNKWDLAAEQGGSVEEYTKYVRAEMPFCTWAPVIFIAAKTGRSVGRIPATIVSAVTQFRRWIPDEEMDRFTEQVKKQHHAVSEIGYNKKRPVIYGVRQEKSEPPFFMVIVDKKEKLSSGLLGFIENRIRAKFGLEGTDIKMYGRELTK
jgi:GTP-binding protein